MKPTIQEIKKGRSPFFDRDTMKHYGQTMKDFKVEESPTGRIFIYAPIRAEGFVSKFTFREYKRRRLLPITDEHIAYPQTEQNILDYIAAH